MVVKTLAFNGKYPVLNRDNLAIPIQRQLYQKLKAFSEIFSLFPKSRLDFVYFE